MSKKPVKGVNIQLTPRAAEALYKRASALRRSNEAQATAMLYDALLGDSQWDKEEEKDEG